MDVLIALVWFFGSIAAIFFIFKPNPKLPPFANRKRAAGMLAAIFIGGPILGALVTPTDGSTPSAPAKPKTPEEIKAEEEAAARKAEEERQEAMREHPERFIEFTSNSAYKGGFDTVFILKGTLKNTGQVAYKDPVIECEVFSETNTRLGRVKDVLYKSLPPGESVRFNDFNMGFVDSDWGLYSCSVEGATVAVG